MEILLGLSILVNAALVVFTLLDKRSRDKEERRERQELYNRISQPGLIVEELPDGDSLPTLPLDDDVAHHAVQGHQEAAQELAEQATDFLSQLNEPA